MNNENLKNLTEQLKAIGIDSTGFELSRFICFKPERFCLLKNIPIAGETLSVQLYFEREVNTAIYKLLYYDAFLNKPKQTVEGEINGIDIPELEKSLSAINWTMVFTTNPEAIEKRNEKEDQLTIEKIEMIIAKLEALEKTDSGQLLSSALKSKYWSAIPGHETFILTGSVKTKPEIMQRFYFLEGQAAITVNEAIRFLQNRWQEKLIQTKRKTQETQTKQRENSLKPATGKNHKKKQLGKRNTATQNN